MKQEAVLIDALKKELIELGFALAATIFLVGVIAFMASCWFSYTGGLSVLDLVEGVLKSLLTLTLAGSSLFFTLREVLEHGKRAGRYFYYWLMTSSPT